MVDEVFLGEENEWLIIYSKEVLQKQHFDYFIFGHRHLPIDVALNNGSRYINLGEWIKYNSYVVFNGESLTLQYYKED
jgi:UDP-2,3-diacylglucosamine hydrolase